MPGESSIPSISRCLGGFPFCFFVEILTMTFHLVNMIPFLGLICFFKRISTNNYSKSFFGVNHLERTQTNKSLLNNRDIDSL